MGPNIIDADYFVLQTIRLKIIIILAYKIHEQSGRKYKNKKQMKNLRLNVIRGGFSGVRGKSPPYILRVIILLYINFRPPKHPTVRLAF